MSPAPHIENGPRKQYKDFPKGDARRYFVILLAIASMPKGEATLHRVAEQAGCARSEVQHAVDKLCGEFGVLLERRGPAFHLASWGVLKKAALQAHIDELLHRE